MYDRTTTIINILLSYLTVSDVMVMVYCWEIYLRVSSFPSYTGPAPLDTLVLTSIFSAEISGAFLSISSLEPIVNSALFKFKSTF